MLGRISRGKKIAGGTVVNKDDGGLVSDTSMNLKKAKERLGTLFKVDNAMELGSRVRVRRFARLRGLGLGKRRWWRGSEVTLIIMGTRALGKRSPRVDTQGDGVVTGLEGNLGCHRMAKTPRWISGEVEMWPR